MELLNILESSFTKSSISSFKVKNRLPSPPGDPNKRLKWYKSVHQNDCILSSAGLKVADDAPKYQV